ncbi:uncharacterized protein LOC112047986 [Bicyclus anynana]|uniref:Uncharacterized protein LOC112047986 n=1 Tax=Bicyclus anynana TaxID=110368 RepID=A0ABM3M5F6_BICAN|nr:uncharacterized protein LOC112047986 [Bicyclus anynana]
MGPKKGKEANDNENYWRTSIEETPLDDDSWKVKVIIIEAAGSDPDRIYLGKFETYAAEERRFVIKNICKTETIFMINQLGGEKKVKDDNLRVFEEGQAYLKEKKDIPPEILALIIKHLIIKMKTEYIFIKNQKLKVTEGMKRESSTMIDKAEVRGTVNDKLAERLEVTPPPLKGKKEEKTDPIPVEDENKKYNTLLRVRGEEWRDKVYIDDYPTDGPSLYVAVTGFADANLPACLVKIGIPLTAVVQIRINPATTKVPTCLTRASKRGQSQTELLAEKSLKYWEDIQLLRLDKDIGEVFKNTAFVVFSPPYWNNSSLSGNAEQIYNEISFLLYDLQDLSRQHTNYLKNMEIINVPEEYKDDRYLSIYGRHIDGLPFESITSFLVLDSILQTISDSQSFSGMTVTSSIFTTISHSPPKSNDDDKLQQSQALVNEFINQLCQTDSRNKNYRFTYGNEYESLRNPIVINYGDFCKYNTFHLGNINLENIVSRMLIGMPINKLWMNRNKLTEEIEAKIKFHVNVLLSCFNRTDVEIAELNRLLHILACRKLYNNRSSLKKEHLVSSTLSEFKKTYLNRSVLAEPLSKSKYTISTSSTSSLFPSLVESNVSYKSSSDEQNKDTRIKLLFDCPDISELVSAAEIAIQRPISHMIDDFEYFEDFTGIKAFQVLQDAFNKYNCVDYKYCEVTDSFIMMFYNSQDNDGIARKEWRCHLPTSLCLQDFFDFVLKEHYDWIKDEEKMYEENILVKSRSEYKDFRVPLDYKSCVDENDVKMELLMEGSLKYEEITNLDTPNNESSQFKTSASKRTSLFSGADSDAKSSKKQKSPATVTPKLIISQLEQEKSKLSKKTFSGYDLGDRRVEVFGKDSSYFSKDGTQISTFYTLVIPMNLEYITLNVLPGNSQNEFWMHKVIGEFIKPEIINACESFRISSKDELIIYIKKQTYQIPIPLVSTSSCKQSSVTSISHEKVRVPQLFEHKSYHSVFVTWPNGLITESVYKNNSPIFSHIKQYYNCSPSQLDEEMRCISLNGEVIIFKNNGDINILLPDASYINITKCRKEIVSDEILEDVSSADISTKVKKVKVKSKSKGKAFKSSKNNFNEDEHEIASKPVEYKLVIEEFETIDANGFRRKWINHDYFDVEKLLMQTKTNHYLGEIFSKRMDGTTVVLNKDGIQFVTFPNKTRILTEYKIDYEEVFPEWTEVEIENFSTVSISADLSKSKESSSQKSFPYTTSNSETSLGSSKLRSEEIDDKEQRTDGYIFIHIIYTIEHPNFTTITIDKSTRKISIESPNKSCVTFDMENNYEILQDGQTSAKFNGETLNISYEACSKCKSFTKCEVKVKSAEISNVSQVEKNWLKMKDSFFKNVIVNEEGTINVVNDTLSNDSEEVVDSTQQKQGEKNTVENSVTTHGKCNQMYEARSCRFFILARDLTCSELVHREIIEQYMQACFSEPWCSINHYDTFGDHRTLWSILNPLHVTESENWLMDSKLSDKPKYLANMDLKKDCGKGFYSWMRPYKCFQPKPITPDNVLPERLPRAFILRTLEQQWRDAQRNVLKGSKELLNAILRYRHLMESDHSNSILNLPIYDLRTEDGRNTNEVVQAIADRVYEELKNRLAEDVQTRVKPGITTRTSPSIKEESLEGEEPESHHDLIIWEEERTTLVKDAKSATEMRPNLKRYWRRHAEELKEEEFYRYLLREGSVPPYFLNVLGGAIWWEMDKTANAAITKAERSKMKCSCPEKDPAKDSEKHPEKDPEME